MVQVRVRSGRIHGTRLRAQDPTAGHSGMGYQIPGLARDIVDWKWVRVVVRVSWRHK